MGDEGMDTIEIDVGMLIDVGIVKVQLLDDDRICQHIKAGHGFEPETLRTWAMLMRPHFYALDVGAYSGLFSIIAAKRGALPIAVEPLVELQQRIAENAQLNGVVVGVVPHAASNNVRETTIGVNDKVHLTSGASLSRKSGARPVKTWTLDQFNGRPICAIKIDVERHEVEVLEGAIGLLRETRPVLIVECLDEASEKAVTMQLKGLYEAKRRMDQRNILLEPI